MKFKITFFSILFLFTCLPNSADAQLVRWVIRPFVQGFFGSAGEDFYNETFRKQTEIRCNTVYVLTPRVDAIESHLEDIDRQIDGIGQQIVGLDSRLTHVENQVLFAHRRINHVQGRVNLLDNRLNSLEARVDELESWIPAGNLGFVGGFGKLGTYGFSLLNLESNIIINNFDIGLRYNFDRVNKFSPYELHRFENKRIENVISHVRFGSENDPVHFYLGPVTTSGFGYSFIFRDYDNDLIYNTPTLGLKTHITHMFGGFKLLSSDINRDRIRAFKAYVSPIAIFAYKDSESPLTLTKLGGGYVRDTTDILGNDIRFTFADFQVPLVMIADYGSHYILGIHGNYAKMKGLGSGYGIGLYNEGVFADSKIAGWYEYRRLGSQFDSGFFDRFYELDRIYNTGYSKYQEIQRDTIPKNEHFFGVELNTWRILNLFGYFSIVNDKFDVNSFRNYYGVSASSTFPIINGYDEDEVSIWLDFGISYDKRNSNNLKFYTVRDWSDRNDFNSILSYYGSIKANLSKQFSVRGGYSMDNYFYVLPNSPDIEKIKQTQLSVALSYNFGIDY